VLERHIQMHCTGDNKVLLLTKIEVYDLQLNSSRVNRFTLGAMDDNVMINSEPEARFTKIIKGNS
jgi:hypothetical protein